MSLSDHLYAESKKAKLIKTVQNDDYWGERAGGEIYLRVHTCNKQINKSWRANEQHSYYRQCYCIINFKVTKRLDMTLDFHVSLQLPFVSFALIIPLSVVGLNILSDFLGWHTGLSLRQLSRQRIPQFPQGSRKRHALFFSSLYYHNVFTRQKALNKHSWSLTHFGILRARFNA